MDSARSRAQSLYTSPVSGCSITWPRLRTALCACGGDARLLDLTRLWTDREYPRDARSPSRYCEVYLALYATVTRLSHSRSEIEYDETTGKVFLTES